MRILFMGTPDFAVASLKRLVEDGHDVCGVFTQPDKPKNRGHKMAFSPVKEYALSHGISRSTVLRNASRAMNNLVYIYNAYVMQQHSKWKNEVPDDEG